MFPAPTKTSDTRKTAFDSLSVPRLGRNRPLLRVFFGFETHSSYVGRFRFSHGNTRNSKEPSRHKKCTSEKSNAGRVGPPVPDLQRDGMASNRKTTSKTSEPALPEQADDPAPMHGKTASKGERATQTADGWAGRQRKEWTLGSVVAEVASMFALSCRQTEVLTAASEGKCTKEIAFDLGLSRKTVEYFWTQIFVKLGCTSQIEVMSLVLTRAFARFAMMGRSEP